jgi:DNA-binding Lrp family transcriptional regulator
LLFNKVIESIQSLNGTYYLGDPWRLGEKGLTILVPVRCNAPPKRSYILASEDKDKVKITDTGQIDKLKVDNKSGSSVFIRGGTVFKGMSGQDRAVVQGVIILPQANGEPIEVKCVHAHRGIVSGGGFKIMNDLAPQKVYSALQSRDQHRVWGEVQSYSMKSASRLMDRGFDSVVAHASMSQDPDLAATLDVNSKNRTDFSDKIMDALSKVPDYEDQVGVAIINVDGVQGLELFDSPESWKALGKEVVKSFSEIFHQDDAVADLFTINMEAVKDKIRSFLKELNESIFHLEDGTHAINTKLVTCEYTNLNKDCIHIVITRRDEKYPAPEMGQPISPISDIYRDMFGTLGTQQNSRRRYESINRSWVNEAMDSTIVPPVKRPRIGDSLIFGRLMEHSYSFNDLQSKTGIPSATLARRLNQYTDEGYISKVDEGGHARWKLTAKGTVYASEKQT